MPMNVPLLTTITIGALLETKIWREPSDRLVPSEMESKAVCVESRILPQRQKQKNEADREQTLAWHAEKY